MKKFSLDVSSYPVDVEQWVIEDGERKLNKSVEDLNVKKEISAILRLPGIYADGIQSFDGLMLARSIRELEGDSFSIDEAELRLIKGVFDKLIAREHNPANGQVSLGGLRYEEMILRVFGLDR